MNRKQFIASGLATLGAPYLNLRANGTYPAFQKKAMSDMITIGRSKLGKTFGKGECTDFINYLLQQVGARPGNFSKEPYYTWGMPVKGTGRPNALPKDKPYNKSLSTMPEAGEIIQFVNCTFDSKTATSSYHYEFPKHSALVESVTNGYTVTLLQQNSNNQRFVTRQTLDFLSLVTPQGEGGYTLFVVQPPYST